MYSYKTKSQSNRKALTALVVLLTAALLWYLFISLALQHRGYAGEPPVREVMVEAGDTLWGIVKKYGPDNEDPRLLVYQVQTLNGLEGAGIYAGQVLRLPW